MTVHDFVDTHVHFWDHAVDSLRWPWLDPDFDHPRLRDMHRLDAPRFAVEELRAEAGSVPLRKVVHVQCAQESRPGAETAWLQSLADGGGWPQAAVARCRLADERADDVLAAHGTFRAFRGIRDMHAQQDLGSASFLDGWDLLATCGGPLEVMVPYDCFAHVADAARHRRDATIVLGHAGLPVHRDSGYLSRWSSAMAELATEPNVVCKISGLASGADPEWTIDSIRPWVETCISRFGADRCMLATNWPVDRLYGSYDGLVAAYDQITAALPDADRAALFAGTAERVYGI